MSGTIVKRVWQDALHEPDVAGWRIMLDREPLRLAGGTELRVLSETLARALARELSEAGGAPGGIFGADSLALTRLASTQQQRVAPNRQAVIETLLDYAGTDLLSYRARHPQALVAREAASWQPWIDWCADRHGARLPVVEGVMPSALSAKSVASLRQALEAQDDPGLTGLGVLVPALGSLVLGLAVAEGALAPAEATRLALLDEQYQLEQWGPDDETLARHAAVLRDAEDAARFISFSRQLEERAIEKDAGSSTAITRRWLISGRVQGVGYRAWLVQEARALGLSGWVRNLEDGRVEALLRGAPGELARLQEKSGQGPPAARVDQVEAEPWHNDSLEAASASFAHGPTASGPMSDKPGRGSRSIAGPE